MIKHLKYLFRSVREDLRTIDPVIHQDIIDILEDEELKEKYLKKVNSSKGSGIVDVTDILEELNNKK
jgi:hypothetical protein